jgi:hypothetical protein
VPPVGVAVALPVDAHAAELLFTVAAAVIPGIYDIVTEPLVAAVPVVADIILVTGFQ